MRDDARNPHDPGREERRPIAEEFEEVYQLSKHTSDSVRICRSPKALWLIQLEDDAEEHYFDDDDVQKAINLSLQSDSDIVREGSTVMTDVTNNCPTGDGEPSSSALSNDFSSGVSSGLKTQDQPPIYLAMDKEATISSSRDKAKRKAQVLENDHDGSSFRDKGKGKARDLQSNPNLLGMSRRIAALFEPHVLPEEITAEDSSRQRPAAKASSNLDNNTVMRERRSLGEKFSSGKAQIHPNKLRGCRDCLNVPVLPETPTRFKVVRSECRHFVAVSYCWPESSQAATTTYSYRRVSENGSSQEWNAKPPDEVMDRAVAFARACDIQQIWIDKICTSMDKDDEQYQLDLQANAFVFRQAYACIGLLESSLREQRFMNSLARALELERDDIFPRDITRICDDLLGFLKVLALDKFNERAWTLQECVSGRQTLVFAMRTEAGVSFPTRAVGTIAIPQVVAGSFLFTYDELFAFVKCSKRLFTAYSPYDIGINPELAIFMLKRLDEIYPELPQPSGIADRSLSAALALTYLKHRKASSVEDNIAILCNMCGYRYWIDTRNTQQFDSLSCAYVSLASTNGDLSLLTPELFQATNRVQTHGRLHGSWCHRPSELVPNIESEFFREGMPTAVEIDIGPPRVYEISKTDFKCPATIWKVDDRVDLRKVQRDWQRDWNSLWCVGLQVRKIDDEETPEAFEERCDWVTQYLQAHRDQILQGWRDEVIDENVTITRVFNRSVPAEREQGLQIICRILFDILQEIQRSGLESLANSIWLSLRADHLPRLASEDQNLPDTWAEVMGNTRLIWRVTRLFDLHWDAYGAFRQDWIIEKVMSDGYLSYGKAQDGLGDLNTLGRELAKLREQGDLPDADRGIMPMPLEARNVGLRPPDTLIGRADLRHIAIWIARTAAPADTENDQKVNEAVAQIFLTVAGPGTPKAGWLHHDLEGELAAFDVNKRCSIAIPLDAGLERLPHPPERSMSVCWIVEAVHDEAKEHKEGDSPVIASSSKQSRGKSKRPGKKHRRFKVTAKVKGCWPLMECFPMTKYSFSHV